MGKQAVGCTKGTQRKKNHENQKVLREFTNARRNNPLFLIPVFCQDPLIQNLTLLQLVFQISEITPSQLLSDPAAVRQSGTDGILPSGILNFTFLLPADQLVQLLRRNLGISADIVDRLRSCAGHPFHGIHKV